MMEQEAPGLSPVEPTDRRSSRLLGKVRARSEERRSRTADKYWRRKLEREDTAEEIEAKRRTAQLKADARAESWDRTKSRLMTGWRSFMVIGPIGAPMSVAWTGQAAFAMKTLMWSFPAGILYAAAYELTTMFCAWMYHEARKDGDKGWEYRIATWLFALGAATQQWWHYADNWSATPRAVTFSSMTIVGLIVWELYARLIHRRKLREDGKISGSRPRLGLARWVRYPRISFTAWSMAVLHDLSTLEEAWTAAEIQRAQRRSEKDLKKEVRTLRKQVQELTSGDPDQQTIEIERADLPDPVSAKPRPPVVETRKDPAPEPIEADRRELEPGPSSDPDDGEFVPTPIERQAIRGMVDNNIRINRENVADYVRNTLNGQIATKRAAEVAKWGRNQAADIRSVG